jgi:crossover junction endodeoxyribonuclease RusA
MEIQFPVEFLVRGTPVSYGAKRRESFHEWKERVKTSCRPQLPEYHFASGARISMTLFYLPDEPRTADIDNIAKGVLDALGGQVYIDDLQVDRLLAQKFDPGNVFEFSNPSEALLNALTGERPVLYVRISDNPFEELV